MRNLGRLFTILLLLSGLLIYFWPFSFQNTESPIAFAPTEGPHFSEEDGLHFLRGEWWDQIHLTSANVDWRQLEYQTQWSRYQNKRQNLSFRSEDCFFSLSDGSLKGFWEERGSINQAGSIYRTEYEVGKDEIWLISAGGSLWKGKRDGSEWTVVNQGLQFDPWLLKWIDYRGKKRLLAAVGRIPHYSDDLGVNWKPTVGIEFSNSTGRIKAPIVVNDSTIYILSQLAEGQNVQLHKSADGAENFQLLHTLSYRNLDQVNLFLPFHSSQLFVAIKNEDNNLSLYQLNHSTGSLDALPAETPLNMGVIPVNLTGWQTDTLSRWYSYVEKNNALRLFKTEDQGLSWQDQGLLPAVPWEVGITASPSDPDLLFLGEVECFRSQNGGKNWRRINRWYDYYNDVGKYLHADMMSFGEYTAADGATFMLIGHHGGLSYSEDSFREDHRNLGLDGLNITQYYDARISPLDSNVVFAGSQDQGLQINTGFINSEPSPLRQILPGDYDYLTYTRGGRSLWAVSPGGWLVYLADAVSRQASATWTLPNYNNAIWFPPITALPSDEEDKVLMGGGSLAEGSGAYLIELKANGNQIQANQLIFDFQLASGGGLISATKVSTRFPASWYAATTNGYFFYSSDKGQNWNFSRSPSSEADLFYSQAILPSLIDPNTIYWSGTGYDQAPVYRSTNGGQSFEPFSTGLPPTIVFDLAANEDESFIFAATQAGPYVYSRLANQWFDLSTDCTPTQYYFSVEFIESLKKIRFGTFGRGIWDFKLDETVAAPSLESAPGFKVYPNPTNGPLQLEFGDDFKRQLRWGIWTEEGKLLRQGQIAPQTTLHHIDLSDFPAGVYFLRLYGDKKTISRKVVKY